MLTLNFSVAKPEDLWVSVLYTAGVLPVGERGCMRVHPVGSWAPVRQSAAGAAQLEEVASEM